MGRRRAERERQRRQDWAPGGRREPAPRQTTARGRETLAVRRVGRGRASGTTQTTTTSGPGGRMGQGVVVYPPWPGPPRALPGRLVARAPPRRQARGRASLARVVVGVVLVVVVAGAAAGVACWAAVAGAATGAAAGVSAGVAAGVAAQAAAGACRGAPRRHHRCSSGQHLRGADARRLGRGRRGGPEDLEAEAAGRDLQLGPALDRGPGANRDPAGFGRDARLGSPPACRDTDLGAEPGAGLVEAGAGGPEVPRRAQQLRAPGASLSALATPAAGGGPGSSASPHTKQ